MEQDSKQEDSLKKTVSILAEMTRKDIQKLDNFSDTKLSLPKTVLISYPLLKEL